MSLTWEGFGIGCVLYDVPGVGVDGRKGVYQDLSRLDLYPSTFKAPAVCRSTADPKQEVRLPGSSFRIDDESTVTR